MKKILSLVFVAAVSLSVWAQPVIPQSNSEYFNSLRSITTAVPIISISPDSRAGGMGDVGVASSPDANSLYWNPAKLAFLPDGSNSLSISYTPWLNKLVNDINLAYVSYVFKISDNQGAGLAMRYFSLGEINFKDEENNSLGTGQPYEMAINGAYSLKLSEQMSLAVGLRWIFSDLLNGPIQGQANTKPGKSFAADLGYYYESREFNMEGGMKQSFAAGINVSNVGGKISYGNDSQSDYIPTNLRLGGAYRLRLDQYNRMAFLLDFNKLLVPSPTFVEQDDENNNGVPGESYNDQSVNGFEGIFKSFGDAPGGASEELEEVVVNAGVEYWYDNRLAFRGGYQYEDAQKGGRQYFTMGIGLKYNVFGLDFAYLIPASATVKSPLENTLRFTLLFDFENFAEQ